MKGWWGCGVPGADAGDAAGDVGCRGCCRGYFCRGCRIPGIPGMLSGMLPGMSDSGDAPAHLPRMALPPSRKEARRTLIPAQGEMASTTAKLEREAPESRRRAPACRLAVTNTSRRRNNSVIRLATGAGLQRQRICHLSLRQHHGALSGSEERWCNRCHCDGAERGTVTACRPAM